MKKLILTSFSLLSAICLLAQTEFVLDPSELEPDPEGFFIGGVTYDFNGDDIDDYINGCPGELDFEDYERRDPFNVTYDLHIESGEQQGFTYKNTMILPTCDGKYESELDPPLPQGFIQLRPLIDTSDVDLLYSYIQSPEISNLQSITMVTSSDVSIQPDSRLIPYNIEYSTDGGETFSDQVYITDVVQVAGGYRTTYTAESSVDFADIQSASQSQNIVLRFITNYDSPELGLYKGQYVKVHGITIVADSASSETGPLSLRPEKQDIVIQNQTISSLKGNVYVHTLSGKLIGHGKAVPVTRGLYLITSDAGSKRKVFIK